MSDPITWLRTQLDEDGWTAQAALDEAEAGEAAAIDEAGRLVIGNRTLNVWATAHVGRWHPSRVLAEVKVKRQLILAAGDYEATIDGEWGCGHDAEAILAGQCPDTAVHEIGAIRLLALPYAGRDGYAKHFPEVQG